MHGKDKRRAERNNHDSVIELFDEKGKFFASGRLTDFSELGASFSIAEPAALPEKFRARLRLLSKGVLEVEAQVVRTRKDRNTTHYAVKFNGVKRVHPTGELKDTWQ
jgi:hypothetical protein